MVVSLEKEFPGHAQKLMNGLWGQGQMSFCKTVVVVDKKTNPDDTISLIDHLCKRLDLQNDITLSKGVLDVLDHSSPFVNFGAKLGIDLTTRFPGEPSRTKVTPLPPLPDLSNLLQQIQRDLPFVENCRHLFAEMEQKVPLSNRFLAVSVERPNDMSGKEVGEKLIGSQYLQPFNVLILFDKEIDLTDASRMLWKVFNNVDPARDMVLYKDRMAINACIKGPADGHTRPWPDELTFGS